MENFGENIGILKYGTLLSIDTKMPVVAKNTNR